MPSFMHIVLFSCPMKVIGVHTVKKSIEVWNDMTMRANNCNFGVIYPFKMSVYICDFYCYSKVKVGGASGSNLLFMDMNLTLPQLD